MNPANSDNAGVTLARARSLALPLASALLIFVILQPLAPAVMDMLLVGNIALSALVLLTAFFVASPSEFSVFPSLLLGTTLLRLGLNVATTRLILTAGADGRGLEQAQQAVGQVIWSFARFVTSDSLEVGIIIFAVLAIIQFVVITKGAGRISEVAARFVLDAMPGRQMAIDADLASGAIDQQQARQRRAEVERQADFYGAMDGASKFLRGDAVAAVLITLVNILGGMYVGLVKYGWSLGQTAELFTRLAIGDGLVAQVPAFLVSMAAALMITRSNARSDFSNEVVRQLTARPVALGVAGVLLGLLALTDLPRLPLAVSAVGCGGLAWLLRRSRLAQDQALANQAGAQSQDPQALLATDPIRLDLGFALLAMAQGDKGGDLVDRLSTLRKQLADELGVVLPAVKVKDDMRLDSHAYSICLRGHSIAGGKLYPRQVLALGAEPLGGELEGRSAFEPVFGTPAMWINRGDATSAEAKGYTVVTASAVLMAHLAHIIRTHAQELLTRQVVSDMLSALAGQSPTLAAEVKRKFNLGQVQRVMAGLLAERVSVRDLETVLEAMCEGAERTDDVERIVEHVRGRLARPISRQHVSSDGRIWCVDLDPRLERALAAEASSPLDKRLTTDAAGARRIAEQIQQSLAGLRREGRKPVVVCAPQARLAVRKLLAGVEPDAAVLAYSEIESAQLKSVGQVRIET